MRHDKNRKTVNRVCFKPVSALLIFVLVLLLSGPVLGQEELRVLNTWLQYTDAENALYHHLTNEAFELLDKREAEIKKLTTVQDWEQRQDRVRNTLSEIIGPFPEKTPLNARTVSTVYKDGFRVENIIFESMPGFYVIASLFIPKGLQEKAPAILFCSGHSGIAYRRPYYQLPLLNLVNKGFIVLALDPIGQGERLEYFDPETGQSRIGSSTKEHSYPSVQTFLAGISIARYFTWDGIRAIDYLLTRPEVDPERIGCHGLSGGGTQTAYISAMDDRIYASAPTGYITSYRRLMQSDGVQDGEQNIYHGLVRGIDHADYIEVRAPKPTLVVATTRDFFSIQGARETFLEAQQVFSVFGDSENLSMVEDDHEHGYTQKTREAIYAFFQKHLKNPGPCEETDVDYLTVNELQKTKTGQVSTFLKSNSVFDINRKESLSLVTKLNHSRQDISAHLKNVKKKAIELSGFKTPQYNGSAVFCGRYPRDGYVLEKYFISGEGGYAVPFLLLLPGNEKPEKAIFYLHPDGKSSEALPGGEMEWFVKKGYMVLAPDLPGIGELGPGDFTGDAYLSGFSFNQWYNSILIGRSIVGIQAAVLIKLMDFIKVDRNVENISVVARGATSSLALHAAVFESSIQQVALLGPLLSFEAIVMNRYYAPKFVSTTVAGALTAYDLPDLAACLAPRKLLMVNVTDQNGHQLSHEFVDSTYSITKKVYKTYKMEENLKWVKWQDFQKIDDIFKNW